MTEDDDGDGGDPTPEADGDDGDRAPLSDLRDRVRERRAEREGAGRAPGEGDDSRAFAEEGLGADVEEDPFEEREVEDLDEEEVWSAIDEETDDAVLNPQVGDGSAERVSDDPVEHRVDKSLYCQRCPHFGAPPRVSCTHEGTEIVAVEDVDHFRVRDCPITADEDADEERSTPGGG